MRILFLTYHGGAGGVSKIVYDLAKVYQRKQEVDLSVCYASFLGIYGKALKRNMKTVYCLNMRNGYDLPRAIRLISIIRRGQYDIVHLHYFTPLLRLIVRLTRIKHVVQTEHGSIKGELGGKRWPLMKLIHMILSNFPTLYTAVSNDSKHDLISNGLVGKRRIEVIYNGIFPENFKRKYSVRKKLRNQLGIRDRETVIGTVRSLTPKMGIDHLLFAAQIVLRENHRVKFLIVGGGVLIDRLKSLSCALGIDDSVIFVGERDDVPRFLSAMDIFVMPSVWETFGIAAVEAMAAELPVVAYPVGGLKEVVQDRVNGLLTSERDVRLLAEAISSLIINKFRVKVMSRNGYRLVCTKYDVRKVAQEYVELYRNILNS